MGGQTFVYVNKIHGLFLFIMEHLIKKVKILFTELLVESISIIIHTEIISNYLQLVGATQDTTSQDYRRISVKVHAAKALFYEYENKYDSVEYPSFKIGFIHTSWSYPMYFS